MQCKSCFMDTSDPELTFSNGVCNYCHEFIPKIQERKQQLGEGNEYLIQLFEEMKSKSKHAEYDAALGISGGVDSSYIALLAKEHDVNLLLVHCDNGWNSKVAVTNIERLLNFTNFDYETEVLDWNNFRDIQRSLVLAGVIDIEMVADHANRAVMFDIANRYKINNVISGENLFTEHGLPQSWSWNKRDIKNIRDIHKRMSGNKVKNFPILGTFREKIYSELNIGFDYYKPLNNLVYRQKSAIKELGEKLGFVYYGGKHYESIFTKVYQCHILPTKFGVDKRKAHLSDILRNEEITYEQGSKILDQPPWNYPEFEYEKSYVVSKLGFTESEFDSLMKQPPVPHDTFKTDLTQINRWRPVYRFVKGLLK